MGPKNLAVRPFKLTILPSLVTERRICSLLPDLAVAYEALSATRTGGVTWTWRGSSEAFVLLAPHSHRLVSRARRRIMEVGTAMVVRNRILQRRKTLNAS